MRASISRRAPSSAPWSNAYGPNRVRSSPTRPAARAVSFSPPTTSSPTPANFNLDKDQKAFLKYEAFHGNEIVTNTRRLCLMNMFLHNIGEIDGGVSISPNDSLVADSGKRFDYVLANPPFGKKSSMSFTNEEGKQEKDDLTYNRQDFWATTSNKQLNFVQHIRTMLKTTGRAAVVVPDNVLFEGGAGETIRRKLLDNTDLHTVLRLPTGVFYAQGVKANVIFFDNREASPGSLDKAGLVLRLPNQCASHAEEEADAFRELV